MLLENVFRQKISPHYYPAAFKRSDNGFIMKYELNI